MRRTERIHHEYVAKTCYSPREVIIVTLFPWLETYVFTQHGVAGRNLYVIQPRPDKGNGSFEQLAEALSDGLERKPLFETSLLGSPEVRHQQHSRALIERQLDRRQGCSNPFVVGDDAFRHRCIQVLADEDSLRMKREIYHALDRKRHPRLR